MVRPDVLNLSEESVLNESLKGWLDGLQAEALRRTGSHSLWKQIAVRFDAELAPQARDRFATELRTFELKESEDLEGAGRALVAGLENNPPLLYTLRGGKFALDLGIIGAVVYFTWPPGWLLLLLPLGVSATQQVVELATRGVAEGARHRIRSHREALVTTTLSVPLADWLTEWPSTGGSAFEKLQQVLRRVPESIRQMEVRVTVRVAAMGRPKPPPLPPQTAQQPAPGGQT
jgi:predicted secreted protein